MRILVVVAHPDDESFFAGGSLAQHARVGDEVMVYALADGVGSRFDHSLTRALSVDEHAAIDDRREAFDHAMVCLSAKGHILDVFPDQQADRVSLLSITRAVRALMHFNPELVYTHHVGDLNVDHRRVAEAVLVVTRGRVLVRSMTPEWPKRSLWAPWAPNHTRRFLSEDLEAKVQACLCYREELRDYPHLRSERAIREQMLEEFMEYPA